MHEHIQLRRPHIAVVFPSQDAIYLEEFKQRREHSDHLETEQKELGKARLYLATHNTQMQRNNCATFETDSC